MKEIIALQQYTDKYVSFYQGEIRNITDNIADKLIAKGIVRLHTDILEGGSSGGGGADSNIAKIYNEVNYEAMKQDFNNGYQVILNDGGDLFLLQDNETQIEGYLLAPYFSQGILQSNDCYLYIDQDNNVTSDTSDSIYAIIQTTLIVSEQSGEVVFYDPVREINWSLSDVWNVAYSSNGSNLKFIYDSGSDRTCILNLSGFLNRASTSTSNKKFEYSGIFTSNNTHANVGAITLAILTFNEFAAELDFVNIATSKQE